MAVPETLKAKQNGNYEFSKYDTGDGLALRPAARALAALENLDRKMESIFECQTRHFDALPPDMSTDEMKKLFGALDQSTRSAKAAYDAAKLWYKATVNLEREIFVTLKTTLHE